VDRTPRLKSDKDADADWAMSRVTLFRLRKVWLPTAWGWLFLLLLGTVMCFLVVRNIYSFLAPNEPVGARVLVVEGWLAPEELDQAVRTFKKGRYERVVATGGPVQGSPELLIRTSYAQMAADYLAQRGIPRDLITVVPAPASAQERTFLSAVMFRKSMQQTGITLDAIDIISSGAHARRSRLLFQMALGPAVRVGVLAARPADYEPETWWRTTEGMSSVAVQSLGLAWVKCFFWPGPPGSQEELWGAPSPTATGNERK
jgi:uncharacterized SAM-binding protein YcdF (DUF218 family)